MLCDFGGYKNFTTRWSGGRVQGWVQVWAPAGHLTISPKAVPEGNRRFRGQINGQALGAALLRIGRASTNTGLFRVGGSRCGPDRLAWGKHATTHAILTQLKSQQGLMLCKFRAATSHFFMWNENFDGIAEKLLPTKAAPIASPNLSIIHWSLSKNMT